MARDAVEGAQLEGDQLDVVFALAVEPAAHQDDARPRRAGPGTARRCCRRPRPRCRRRRRPSGTPPWSTPLRVWRRVRPEMTPPVQTVWPSRRSASWLTVASIWSRSWARRPCSGCDETYRPSASFSKRSRMSESNSSAPIAGWWAHLAGRVGGQHVEQPALPLSAVAAAALARGRRRRQRLEHAAARVAGRVEGAALDQRLERAPVDEGRVDARAEVVDRAERTVGARRDDRLDGADPHPLDRVQAEADLAADDGKADLALVDVGRQHLDAHLVALVHVERHLVLGVHDARHDAPPCTRPGSWP